MTDLPTRRFVEVVCTNPKHEYWDQHDWDGNDCIVKVNEPLQTRAEWEATINLSRDDIRDIAGSAGVSLPTMFWILDELRSAAKETS